MKLKPVGTKLLVLPLSQEEYVTETNIHLVESELERAKVVEVSDEISDVYKKGDVVLYPKSTGILQIYNGKKCLWINGAGYPSGDVWAIAIESKK